MTWWLLVADAFVGLVGLILVSTFLDKVRNPDDWVEDVHAPFMWVGGLLMVAALVGAHVLEVLA